MNISWRKIRQKIQSHADSYVVAVSGGVDSMFLLDFMSRCDVRLHVAHVDHKLRENSYLERILVEESTKALGLPFSYHECSSMAGVESIEAEARNQRYAYLQEVRLSTGSAKIITAHHLNDQVETILLRLMRGHDHNTLGMRVDNGTVFRPLLEVPKELIRAESVRRGLKWIEDPTNASIDFERNWVRNSLIPQMLERRNVLQTIPKGLLDE